MSCGEISPGPSLEGSEVTRKIERALHRVEEKTDKTALQNDILEKKLGEVSGIVEDILEILQNGSTLQYSPLFLFCLSVLTFQYQ